MLLLLVLVSFNIGNNNNDIDDDYFLWKCIKHCNSQYLVQNHCKSYYVNIAFKFINFKFFSKFFIKLFC